MKGCPGRSKKAWVTVARIFVQENPLPKLVDMESVGARRSNNHSLRLRKENTASWQNRKNETKVATENRKEYKLYEQSV